MRFCCWFPCSSVPSAPSWDKTGVPHLQARVSDGLRKSLFFYGDLGRHVCRSLHGVCPFAGGPFFQAIPLFKIKLGYLPVVPVGYAFVGAVCHLLFGHSTPLTASLLFCSVDAPRGLALAIPAAMIGDQIAGMHGLLLGLVSASILSALTGVFWMKSLLFPYGEAPAGGQSAQTVDVMQWLRDNPCWATFESNMDNLMQLDSMRIHPVGKHQLGFYVGAIELGHLESKGVLDIPLPVEVGDNRFGEGVLNPHRFRRQRLVPIHTQKCRAKQHGRMGAVGLSHCSHELSNAVKPTPLLKQKWMPTESPQCVTAMRAAAARWKALPATR